MEIKKLKLDELNRVGVDDFKKQDKNPIVFVLDNVRSMNNVGSFFRTADALALSGVYLCGITAKPPHREIEKTALGATMSVDWQYFESTLMAIEYLRAEGYKILAAEQVENSIMLQDFKPSITEKYAVVFGNEVNGVEEIVLKNIDSCIEIPQFGTKHSYNIVVSAGIIGWDLISKFKYYNKG